MSWQLEQNKLGIKLNPSRSPQMLRTVQVLTTLAGESLGAELITTVQHERVRIEGEGEGENDDRTTGRQTRSDTAAVEA